MAQVATLLLLFAVFAGWLVQFPATPKPPAFSLGGETKLATPVAETSSLPEAAYYQTQVLDRVNNAVHALCLVELTDGRLRAF